MFLSVSNTDNGILKLVYVKEIYFNLEMWNNNNKLDFYTYNILGASDKFYNENECEA